ncbi:MAG: anti-sigma regulatory factor [Aquisalimonadaceae bacterium]
MDNLQSATGIRVPIANGEAIVSARQQAREVANSIGMSTNEATMIATAVSELARNIIDYAGEGELIIDVATNGAQRGVLVIVCDQGPGIPNLDDAMLQGFSTSGGLGLGLPGVRRIMDEFDIQTSRNEGTTVMVTKWKR